MKTAVWEWSGRTEGGLIRGMQVSQWPWVAEKVPFIIRVAVGAVEGWLWRSVCLALRSRGGLCVIASLPLQFPISFDRRRLTFITEGLCSG